MSFTLREYRSDLELILKKSKISRDSRISLRQLEMNIHKYRARGIHEQFDRKHQIDPTWIQPLGVCPLTPVTTADDLLIPSTSRILMKYTIPTVIQLPEDRGVYRVSGTARWRRYHQISEDRFFELVAGGYRAMQDYYFRMGNAIYIAPGDCDPPREASIDLILDNPMEGYRYFTEYLQPGQLVVGNLYKVVFGAITHNAIVYGPNTTFTAVNNTFSGPGKVMADLGQQKRMMTIDDPYPMSVILAEYVMMKILTQEFKIETQEIADIRNDSSDELLVRQDERK